MEQRDGGYWVAGTRVSLDSIVYSFLTGLSPETIVSECFPVLTLEQVYGAIAYYLGHRAEIDAYLKADAEEFEAFREEIRARYPRAARRIDELARLQADNDLNQRIVAATPRLDSAIDFQTAVAAGLHLGVPDEEVLARAAGEGRVLVTRDRRTMPEHFARFIATRTSPGVIVVSRHLTIGQAAEWLHLIWAASEAEEYCDSICAIP